LEYLLFREGGSITAWLPLDVIYLHYTEIFLCLTMVSALANEHR